MIYGSYVMITKFTRYETISINSIKLEFLYIITKRPNHNDIILIDILTIEG